LPAVVSSLSRVLCASQVGAGVGVEDVARGYGIARDDVLAAVRYAASRLAEEQVRAVS
jgi:uncharacterized protein (DUF433 family)